MARARWRDTTRPAGLPCGRDASGGEGRRTPWRGVYRKDRGRNSSGDTLAMVRRGRGLVRSDFVASVGQTMLIGQQIAPAGLPREETRRSCCRLCSGATRQCTAPGHLDTASDQAARSVSCRTNCRISPHSPEGWKRSCQTRVISVSVASCRIRAFSGQPRPASRDRRRWCAGRRLRGRTRSCPPENRRGYAAVEVQIGAELRRVSDTSWLMSSNRNAMAPLGCGPPRHAQCLAAGKGPDLVVAVLFRALFEHVRFPPANW
jgi:hypothetical protein